MSRAEVMQCDAFQALTRLTRKFDLVFADPPYGQDLAEMLLDKLVENSILADGAIVIVESGRKEISPSNVQYLRQIDRRIYGDTALTFFEFTD
jgi:16S rRNA G966 N2-methylase RsmD